VIYLILKNKVANNYFQNNWTSIKATDKLNETIVLAFIPSFIIKYVRIEKAKIPVANPMNLPGQS